MPDYQLSKIYKITNDDNDKIYIGSTAQKYLKRRLWQHIRDYEKKNPNGATASYKVLGCKNPQIFLIEEFPCNSKDELFTRERYWIEKFKDICVNMSIPLKTEEEKKETRHQNYLRKKPTVQEYNEKNKESIAKRKAEYNKTHKKDRTTTAICECSYEYKTYDRSRHLKSSIHDQLMALKNSLL